MPRLSIILLLVSVPFCSEAQTTSQPAQTSDPQAVSLAQQSIAALTGSIVISDATLNANVTSFLGSSSETGTAVFKAKGHFESRMDLTTADNSLSEVRATQNGGAIGAWSRNGSTPVPQSPHNLVTDASWFFPAFSCLSQVANSAYVFKYIGQEQHGGVSTQHIRIALVSVAGIPTIQQLSTTDFYLDPTSALPLEIDLSVHPDKDATKNIPVAILFSNYQSANGFQVPYHFQKVLNGSLVLDATVTSSSFNTGLLDAIFTLQ